jgi:hypothetical protein
LPWLVVTGQSENKSLTRVANVYQLDGINRNSPNPVPLQDDVSGAPVKHSLRRGVAKHGNRRLPIIRLLKEADQLY